jgi:hypothetical protein
MNMDRLVYDNLDYYLSYIAALWIVPILISILMEPKKMYNSIYKQFKNATWIHWKGRIRNELFQLLYFMLRGLVRRTNNQTGGMTDYSGRMILQARLALLFGGPDAVMYGDSNCEVHSAYKFMRRHNKLVLCFGVGGTTSHDWLGYQMTARWRQIKNLIGPARMIQNVGGNNALQDRMMYSEASFADLQDLNGNQIALTIPVIYADAFIQYIPKVRQYIDELNRHIENNSTAVIYTEKFTDADGDGIPDPGRLQDLIHYSGDTVRALIREIDKYL